MSEIDRLQTYYPFNTDTLETVAEVAERFHSYASWNQLYDDFQSDSSHAHLNEVTFSPHYGNPIKIIDIEPTDQDNTLIYHFPLGNTINGLAKATLITLSSTLPNTRIIASDDSSGSSADSGNLLSRQRHEVAKGVFRSTIDPILAYVHKKQINQATQIGLSFGVDKAISAGLLAGCFDIESKNVTLINPVSTKPRTKAQLGADFFASTKNQDISSGLAEYSAFNGCAKQTKCKNMQFGGQILKLINPTNLAIAQGIMTGKFQPRLVELLRLNPNTNTTVIWGTESQLALDGLMQTIIGQIKEVANNQVTAMPIQKQSHSMSNDIFLHSALVYESLKKH